MAALCLGLSLAPRRYSIGSPALGPELLQNGDFATDTIWVKGTNWTISDGVASVAAPETSSRLSQLVSFTVGARYQLMFSVVSYTGGAVIARFTNGAGNAGNITTATAVGTYTASATLTLPADALSFTAPNNLAIYSIDNVSLRMEL